MRSNWEGNLELQARLNDPQSDVRVIVEAETVETEAVANRREEWQDADSTTGLFLAPDGTVRLTPTAVSTPVNQTTITPGDYITDLDGTDPQQVCRIEWGGTEDPDIRIDRVKVRVNPDVSGLGQEVERLRLEVWTLVSEPADVEGEAHAQIAGAAEVDVLPDSVEGEFTFEFSSGFQPKRRRPLNSLRRPTTYLVLKALKSGSGVYAGNVGWAVDGASSTAGAPNTVSQHQRTSDETGTYQVSGAVPGVPYVVMEGGTFTATTIAFTLNPFDLLAVPTRTVQFVSRGQTPGGSQITYEVRNDADTAWVPFVDGQTTDDLAGIGKRQTYAMRANLAPNAAGDVGPVLMRLGVRELTRTNLDGMAVVSGLSSAVDPQELVGEIRRSTVTLLRTGDVDYRDPVTELVSTTDIGKLTFRVWIGFGPAGSDQFREHWLHIDDLFPENPEEAGPGIQYTCRNALVKLRQQVLPVPVGLGTGSVTQDPLLYENQTLAAIYADLLDVQAALPARFRGPGVDDSVTIASNRITGQTDVKAQADAIAHLARGAVIASEGRIKFVPFFGPDPIRAVLIPETVDPEQVSPGFHRAQPQFYVPFQWNEARQDFDQLQRHFDLDTIEALGPNRLLEIPFLRREVARWITSAAHAQQLAEDRVRSVGTGLMVWRFRCADAHPYLEPGDVVAVATDRFVARDPKTARQLRGLLWAIGRVVQLGDKWGRTLAVWVQGYADILGASESVTRDGFVGVGQVAPPTLTARAVLSADKDTADLFVTVTSPIAENVRLRVQDSEDALAPVWELVVSGVDPTPRFAADGTELGPADWFHDGTSFAQVLSALALNRDQVRRVFLQGDPEKSAAPSAWMAFALDLRAQPWLESVDLVFDEGVDSLFFTVVAGAHTQSARIEFSDDQFASIAASADVDLADGASTTQSLALVAADRNKEWRARATPFNGPLVAGVVTGLAGVAQEDGVFVPASETGGPQPPTAVIDVLSVSNTQYTVQYRGILGAGGAGPMEYRTRIYTDDPPAFGAYAALDQDPETEGIQFPQDVHGRFGKDLQILELQIRDADGRESAIDSHPIRAQLPLMDGGGKPIRTFAYSDGKFATRASASDGGQVDDLVDDFRGVPLTTMFGKNVDDLDDANDGATFKRTTANEKTGGGRGFNAINSALEYLDDVGTGSGTGSGTTEFRNSSLVFPSLGSAWPRVIFEKTGNSDLPWIEYRQGTAQQWRFAGSSGDTGDKKFLFQESSTGSGSFLDRIRFTVAGDLEHDGSLVQFTPAPPKPAAEMTPRDWLDWALAQATKPRKPYAGLPAREHPEVIAEALERGVSVDVVAAEHIERYGKDIGVIAIGVAHALRGLF